MPSEDSRSATVHQSLQNCGGKGEEALPRQGSSNAASLGNSGSAQERSHPKPQQSPTKSSRRPSSQEGSPRAPGATSAENAPVGKGKSSSPQPSPSPSAAKTAPPPASAPAANAPVHPDATRALLNALAAAVPAGQNVDPVTSMLAFIQNHPAQAQALSMPGGLATASAQLQAAQVGSSAALSPQNAVDQGSQAAPAAASLQRLLQGHLQAVPQQQQLPATAAAASKVTTGDAHGNPQTSGGSPPSRSGGANASHPHSPPRGPVPPTKHLRATPPPGASTNPQDVTAATASAATAAPASTSAPQSARTSLHGPGFGGTDNQPEVLAAAGGGAATEADPVGSEMLKRSLVNNAPESPAQKRGRYTGSTVLRDALARRGPLPAAPGPGRPVSELEGTGGAQAQGRPSEGSTEARTITNLTQLTDLSRLKIPRHSDEAAVGRHPPAAGGGGGGSGGFPPGSPASLASQAPALASLLAAAQGDAASGQGTAQDAQAALGAIMQQLAAAKGASGGGAGLPQALMQALPQLQQMAVMQQAQQAQQAQQDRRDPQALARGAPRRSSAGVGGTAAHAHTQQQQYLSAIAAAAASGSLPPAQAQRLLAAATQGGPAQAAVAAQQPPRQHQAADPAQVDPKRVIASLDPATVAALVSSGLVPASAAAAVAQQRSNPTPAALVSADMPLSAALESQAALRRLSTDGHAHAHAHSRTPPPRSQTPPTPANAPPQGAPDVSAIFAQLEKMFGAKFAASLIAQHVPSLPPGALAASQRTSAVTAGTPSHKQMHPSPLAQPQSAPPTSLTEAQVHEAIGWMTRNAQMLSSQKHSEHAGGAAANNAEGGAPQGAAQPSRDELQAALVAGISAGRIPSQLAAAVAGALHSGAAAQTATPGSGAMAHAPAPPQPSRRKQSPLLNLSNSFDGRGSYRGPKRPSDPANLARTVPRSMAPGGPVAEAPTLLTTTDLTKPGGTFAGVWGDSRGAAGPPQQPPSSSTAAGAQNVPATGGVPLQVEGATGGPSAAAAALARLIPPGGEKHVASLVNALAGSKGVTEASQHTIIASIAQLLEAQQQKQQQASAAAAVAAKAQATAPAQPAPQPHAGDMEAAPEIKQEPDTTMEQKVNLGSKKPSTTDDELQAAALLISLKDSTAPIGNGAAGGSTPGTPALPITPSAPAVGSKAAGGTKRKAAEAAAAVGGGAVARQRTAGSDVSPILPVVGSAAAAVASAATGDDLGSPIAKMLLQQLLTQYKATPQGAGLALPVPPSSLASMSSNSAMNAPLTVTSLPPGVSVMNKSQEEAGACLGMPASAAPASPPNPASLPLILPQASSGVAAGANVSRAEAAPPGAAGAAASGGLPPHTMNLLRNMLVQGTVPLLKQEGSSASVPMSGAALAVALSQQMGSTLSQQTIVGSASERNGNGAGEYWRVEQLVPQQPQGRK